MKNPIFVLALLLLFPELMLQAQGNAGSFSQPCLTDGVCLPNQKQTNIPAPDPVSTPALQHGVLRIAPTTASPASKAQGNALGPSGPCLDDIGGGTCGDPTPTPTPTPTPFPHLDYFGGPVISNVHIVEVLYGSGAFLPQVSSTTPPSIASYFSDILGVNSGYISLLTQYNTPAAGGTNQTIGNGTFDGLVQIVPSAANSGATINDTQIQAELLAQISGGHLPAPVLDAAGNVNSLYMVYFPPGVSITLGNKASCVGFCAYHSTTSTTLNSKNILYGVFPDIQAGSSCSNICGSSTTFNNYTYVTSHELSEAITDADAGLPNTIAFPLAWFDENNGEIADICQGPLGSYSANGTTYTIAFLFSNSAQACVLPPPAPFFTLSASPAALTFNQGNGGSSTITVSPSGEFTGSVILSASGLPAGITANFGANPATSSSTMTLTASATAMAGTATVTITGTSGTLTNTTALPLNITTLATPNSGAAPLTVSFSSASSGGHTLDHWVFGDGQTSFGQNPPIVHTYQAAGTYTATPVYLTGFTRTVPPSKILVNGSPVTISVF